MNANRTFFFLAVGVAASGVTGSLALNHQSSHPWRLVRREEKDSLVNIHWVGRLEPCLRGKNVVHVRVAQRIGDVEFSPPDSHAVP